MNSQHSRNDRYHALDAMRGIAALLVLLYHCAEIMPSLHIQGHICVDFFFALSGFVVARAYQDRLGTAMSFERFALVRMIRLYPLFLAGTLIGASRHLIGGLLHMPEAIPLHSLLPVLLVNAFMLPGPSPNEYIFPLDGPTWSLFFEMAVNLAFGLLLYRWSNRGLWALVVVSGIALVIMTLDFGTSNLGWSWPTIQGGFARVIFAFTLGVLFSRIFIAVPKHETWWALLPLILLTAVMAVSFGERYQMAFDLISLLVLSPILLIMGIFMDVPARLRGVCAWLGDVSYPLYTLHIPFFSFCTFAVERLGFAPLPVTVAFAAAMLVLSHLALKVYDAPLRRWLSRRLHVRPSAAPQTA